MDPLRVDDLTIEVDDSKAGVIALQWLGRSNSRTPSAHLHPYFLGVFGQARRQNARVEMDFKRLEHFNSSTIAALIQMINAAREEGVELVLHYDGTLRWQALSFDALRRALRPFENADTGRVQFVGE